MNKMFLCLAVVLLTSTNAQAIEKGFDHKCEPLKEEPKLPPIVVPVVPVVPEAPPVVKLPVVTSNPKPNTHYNYFYINPLSNDLDSDDNDQIKDSTINPKVSNPNYRRNYTFFKKHQHVNSCSDPFAIGVADVCVNLKGL